jgi:hypothetical protein
VLATQVAFLFQIIEKLGSIPWDELTYPEGRTKKACQVMIDKEKSKIRKERAERGEAEPTRKVRSYRLHHLFCRNSRPLRPSIAAS